MILVDKHYSLRQKQSLPLDIKIKMSIRRIQDFYEHFNGKVYVAFSGGKDSTVLLHLVRTIYPNAVGAFVNTGLEYPEIVEFVKSKRNITILHPKKSFMYVIKQYGYPIVSKMVSMSISRYNKTCDPLQKEYRKFGTKNGIKIGCVGVIPKKWHYLIDAPFKISNYCCDILKKSPFKCFENETKLKPFDGMMASESNMRRINYIKNGCNYFGKKSKSSPLSFWVDKDIWEYIKKFNLSYSKIYDMGEKRTGCAFCLYGIHLEKSPNRFERMKKHHLKLYNYCMNVLGIKNVLNFMEDSNASKARS